MHKQNLQTARLSPMAYAVLVGVLTLTGCDGNDYGSQGSQSSPTVVVGPSSAVTSNSSSSSSSSSSPGVVIGFDYQKLQKTEISGGGLELASQDIFEQHLKNGLRLYLSSFRPYIDPCGWWQAPSSLDDSGSEVQSSSSIWTDNCWIAAPAFGSSVASLSSQAASSADSAGGEGVNADDFSETNTYVAGVDQADFAKYDGQHWYVADRDDYYGEQSQLNIYAADKDAAELSLAGSLGIDYSAADSFYLVQVEGETQAVSFVYSNGSGHYDLMPGIGFWEPGYYANDDIHVDLADVTDPASPSMGWQLSLDGSLIETRKIGNLLYLVSRYEPRLEGTKIDYQDDVIRAANEDVIQNATLEDLLPKVRINDVETVLSPDCYLPQDVGEYDGYRSLVYVTAIDLASREVVDAECINTPVQGLSLTEKSVYLTGSYWGDERQQTLIHKLSHNEDGFDYQATGAVPGSLMGRTDPAFRLHEYNDDLRVVTSRGTEHQLFILEQVGSALEVASQLPNSARPEAIGKPNEDIYAVRFNAKSLQIVTFRQTDPLYNIDLTDRLDPKIAGELEIPGFANYIHYVNDNTVFTLGRDADEQGRVTGLKVALYDISGADPVELQSYIYQGSDVQSAALYDLKALTISPDRTRFTLPVVRYGNRENNYAAGFLLFEVELEGKVPVLNAAGAKRFDAADNVYYRQSRARSVLHADAVFMFLDGEVWADTWQNLTSDASVDDHRIFRCDGRAPADFIEITVSVQDNYACNVNLTITNDVTDEVTSLVGSAGTHEFCHFEVATAEYEAYTVRAEFAGLEAQTVSRQKDPLACSQDPEALMFSF